MVRWRLPSSSATEHHGHTGKATLTDHRASWNYEKTLHVRLTIDRTSILQECEINFEIIQEFPSSEKQALGKIKLNLAEYVDKAEDDEGVVRRYLMYDSKVNSTVQIGIALRQLEGERNFITYVVSVERWCYVDNGQTDPNRPPLKSATVFGGIARVVHSSEPGDSEELGHMASINTKSREVTDMQDMYRRTLAATWTSRACDMPADKLVEELFAGSSCWNNEAHNSPILSESDHSPYLGTETAARPSRSGKRLSPGFEGRRKSASANRSHGDSKKLDTLQKGGSIEQQLYDGAKGRNWKERDAENALSEFNVREDLRSWEITTHEDTSA